MLSMVALANSNLQTRLRSTAPIARAPLAKPIAAPIAAPVLRAPIAPAAGSVPAPVTRPPLAPIEPISNIRRTIAIAPPTLAPAGGGVVQAQPSGAPPSGAPPSMSLGPSQPTDMFPVLPSSVSIAGFSITQGWLVLGGIVLLVVLAVRK
jgi:pyruvate dehydrogenase E2 component (dihydrolipoamide acetyltransferase)